MHEGLLISVEFWICFAIYVIVERGLTGLLPSRIQYLLSLLVSAGFLWYFTSIGTAHLVGLFVGIIAIFVAAKSALGPGKRGTAGARLLLVMAVPILLWTLGKIATAVQSDRFGFLFFLGISFLLVKIWTFCKDLNDGRVKDPSLPAFLAYCLFFPTFISGPMHYYGEFREAFEDRSRLDGVALVDGVFRVLHGLVKVLIVAVALRPFSLDALDGAGFSEVGVARLGIQCLVYSLVIYLDFSGYSDIAIASGGLIGIRVPENFRLPYLAPNLREFWQRWHITFTRFLTQYLFVPFVRVFQQRISNAGPRTTTAVAYLATFLFCGFWHGSTANFLTWGLYHGAGLALYDAYRQRRIAAARAARQILTPPSGPSKVLFVVVTFLFVSFGWVFFTLPMSFWTR